MPWTTFIAIASQSHTHTHTTDASTHTHTHIQIKPHTLIVISLALSRSHTPTYTRRTHSNTHTLTQTHRDPEKKHTRFLRVHFLSHINKFSIVFHIVATTYSVHIVSSRIFSIRKHYVAPEQAWPSCSVSLEKVKRGEIEEEKQGSSGPPGWVRLGCSPHRGGHCRAGKRRAETPGWKSGGLRGRVGGWGC